MRPRHDAAAAVVIVCFLHDIRDFLRGLDRSLVDEAAGDMRMSVDKRRHLRPARSYRLQHFGAVHDLRTDNEPDLLILHVRHALHVEGSITVRRPACRRRLWRTCSCCQAICAKLPTKSSSVGLDRDPGCWRCHMFTLTYRTAVL